MGYKLLYDKQILFDVYSGDYVTDAQLSMSVNAVSYFDFTISLTHSLYDIVAEHAGIIELYFDDAKLFSGEITEISVDLNGNKDITCAGALDYLSYTLVRPYSTIDGEADLLAPSSVDGYFNWLIEQHNKHCLDSRKHFFVGVNQGNLLDNNNYIYRASSELPTTSSEIEDKILNSVGGYLYVRYKDDKNILDLYADTHEANTQIIDFGVNITDFVKTTSTDDQYTAVIATGYIPDPPEDDPQKKMNPITLKGCVDGGTPYSPSIVKMGDVVYDVNAVARYGYKEYHVSNDDIKTYDGLLQYACKVLNKLLSPSLSVSVKAVDLSLYMKDKYEHMQVGQAVRVRSKLHNIDEYLVVNSITLDMNNPENTEYQLGESYDTLTGQQSSYLRSLNSSIVSNLDSVAKLDSETKKNAKDIADTKVVASNAANKANQATEAANSANTKADQATDLANSAKQDASTASNIASEAKKTADKAQADTNTNTKAVAQAQSTADAAKKAAADAQEKAENVESNLESANAVIEQHSNKLGELNTKVSNAVTNANSALTASTEAKQTATEASTTANTAYEDSQTAITNSTKATQTATEAKTTAESAVSTANDSLRQSSSAVQTANRIENTLTTEYQTKTDSDALYATKSSLTETSESIKMEVSATYATKSTVEALQNVADNAIESWRGSGVPTSENKPASDWTTIEEKKRHSGDLYYDKDTGKAYRWGSDDGVVYSWVLNQDTDITKALQDASNAQKSANAAQSTANGAVTAAGNAQKSAEGAQSTADSAKTAAANAQKAADTAQSDVDQLKIDIPGTYATKASLETTAESITAQVESVSTTANSAVTAASKAQQTADAINVNLTKNYQTKENADNTYATKASLSATSEGLSASITKAQQTADGAVNAASNAQQTADAININLTKNYQTTKDADDKYATQSSLNATADSINSTVSSVKTTADSALSNANNALDQINAIPGTYATKTEVNQTATDLTTTITTAQNTANDAKGAAESAQTTANEAKDTADSAKTSTNVLETLIRQSGDGVEVAKKVNDEYTSTKTLMGPDGFYIKDLTDTALTQVKSDAIILGKETESHMHINPDNVRLLNGDEKELAKFYENGVTLSSDALTIYSGQNDEPIPITYMKTLGGFNVYSILNDNTQTIIPKNSNNMCRVKGFNNVYSKPSIGETVTTNTIAESGIDIAVIANVKGTNTLANSTASITLDAYSSKLNSSSTITKDSSIIIEASNINLRAQKNLSINGHALKDFVTEFGTSTTKDSLWSNRTWDWRWIKTYSGKCFAWGECGFNIGCTIAWGSGYYDHVCPVYPFKLSKWNVQASVSFIGGGIGHTGIYDDSATQCPIYIWSAVYQNTGTMFVKVFVEGVLA